MMNLTPTQYFNITSFLNEPPPFLSFHTYTLSPPLEQLFPQPQNKIFIRFEEKIRRPFLGEMISKKIIWEANNEPILLEAKSNIRDGANLNEILSSFETVDNLENLFFVETFLLDNFSPILVCFRADNWIATKNYSFEKGIDLINLKTPKFPINPPNISPHQQRRDETQIIERSISSKGSYYNKLNAIIFKIISELLNNENLSDEAIFKGLLNCFHTHFGENNEKIKIFTGLCFPIFKRELTRIVNYHHANATLVENIITSLNDNHISRKFFQ